MKAIGDLLQNSLVHFENRDYREAEAAINELIDANPDFHRGWFLKGVILEETGRVKKAEECYQKAGNIYNMWFRLALQVQDKDPERALPYYDRVLEADRYSNQALYNKGLIYERLGRPDEAGAAFVKISPFREVLSRIVIPVGFMGFLIGSGITMTQRGERAMSLLVFAAAIFCFIWMKRDAGTAMQMVLKKRKYSRKKP